MYLVINKQTDNIKEFIEFWSQRYDKKKLDKKGILIESKYDDNILNWKEDKTQTKLKQLFIWKNGMDFSEHKNKSNSFENNILGSLKEVKLINDISLDDYFYLFNQSKLKNWDNIVWKLFLLHCLKPTDFPIYDQHVHRAYDFIVRGEIKNPQYYYSSNKIEEKIKFYKTDYISFVKKLENESDFKLKQIDEALVTFGKFLNDYNY